MFGLVSLNRLCYYLHKFIIMQYRICLVLIKILTSIVQDNLSFLVIVFELSGSFSVTCSEGFIWVDKILIYTSWKIGSTFKTTGITDPLQSRLDKLVLVIFNILDAAAYKMVLTGA